MFRKLRFGMPSPATALAFAALLVALSGTAMGQSAVQSAKRLFGGEQIKDNSITTKDIRNGSIRGVDVKDGSLAARDFRAGQVPAGPTGATGPQGQKGDPGRPADPSAKAADADLLDGLNSSDFLGAAGKAADSDKLDGLDSSDFLGAAGKAADSDKLDGLDSTSFTRGGGAIGHSGRLQFAVGQSVHVSDLGAAFVRLFCMSDLVRFRIAGVDSRPLDGAIADGTNVERPSLENGKPLLEAATADARHISVWAVSAGVRYWADVLILSHSNGCEAFITQWRD